MANALVNVLLLLSVIGLVHGATGSIGLEAGIIGAILVCLVVVIGVMILFAGCLWRNPVCCGGQTAA